MTGSKFRVCGSVHLHTFKSINQLDAAINTLRTGDADLHF